eukprot:Em0030g43a
MTTAVASPPFHTTCLPSATLNEETYHFECKQHPPQMAENMSDTPPSKRPRRISQAIVRASYLKIRFHTPQKYSFLDFIMSPSRAHKIEIRT